MKRSIPLVALVLATVVLVVQARIVIGGKTWDDTRYHTEVAPPRLAASEAIQARVMPVWWEGSGLGVPLLGEPSHGAAYPPMWLAASPHLLDLIWILHLFWAALGVALWARRLSASDLGAVVAGVLVATTGVLASAAIRGALPALAHLPWIALSASMLAAADTRRQRARAAIALGVLIGAVGLAGQCAVLVHAIALGCLVGLSRRRKTSSEPATRGVWRFVVAAIGAGLAISAAQWVPAIHVIATTAGADLDGLKLARLLELLVPGSFGSEDPDRGVIQLAGTAASFPSLYVGAPLLALAMITRPTRQLAGFALVLGVLAFVVGRGGWPTWLGAPELHIAALMLIAAAHAGTGVDAVLVGERRALLALAGAAAASAIALGALGALRAKVDSPALDRALLDGGLGFLCITIALVVTWRGAARSGPADMRSLIIVVLLVAPSVGALPSNAPAIERAVVNEQPAWARAARTANDVAPVRVYRPLLMFDGPTPKVATAEPQELAEAIARLTGTSAARWGIGSARSEDPARPINHDGVWLAAAAAGGQLLDRYSIALAILPGSTVEGRNLVELGKRGNWSLARYPSSPPAAIVHEWIWVDDVETAIARLFPPGAGRGLPAGLIVLHGTGSENQDEPSDPQPCTIQRWGFGTIWLGCATDQPAYAVVSSTAAEGWTVEVDGRPAAWVTADVLRRAVAVPAGAQSVAWFYTPPGWHLGLVLAALGVVGLFALWLLGRRS